MFRQYNFLLAVALQVLFSCVSAKVDVNAAGDAAFANYLEDAMANKYAKWIIESHQDPSEPLPDTVILPPPRHTIGLQLNCAVTNLMISGHSNGSGDVGYGEVYFNRQVFAVARDVYAPYEFNGTYICSGLLFAYAHEELSSDLPFLTSGNFTAHINSSEEIMEYRNFGITDSYRFNTRHSWYNYLFIPDLEHVKLVGTWDSWDNATIDKYASEVEGGFYSSFSEFLTREGLPQGHLNPSRVIFVRFVDELLRTTKLTEVLSGDDLPAIYNPTPSPPTTPTTKATTTTRVTTVGTQVTTSRVTNVNTDTTTVRSSGAIFSSNVKPLIVGLVTFLSVRYTHK